MAIVFLLLATHGGVAGSHSEDLEVWLESPQSVYAYCSDPSLYLFVINQGTDTVAIPYVNDHSMGHLELTIVNQDGRKLPYTGGFDNDRYDDVNLVPGDTMMFTIRLLETHALRPVPWHSYPPSLPISDYSATAVYWDNTSTDEFTFRIRKLNELEEDVIRDYQRVRNQYHHGLDRLSDFIELFRNYGNEMIGSRIAKSVVNLSMSNAAPDSLQIHYAAKFLDLYPENGNARVAYMRLMNLLGDEGFTQLMHSRRSLLENKYSRFLLKQAAHELGKSHLVEEVMGDEKNE
jgi:hypothetical protein